MKKYLKLFIRVAYHRETLLPMLIVSCILSLLCLSYKSSNAGQPESTILASNLIVISSFIEMTIEEPGNPYTVIREQKWTNWVGRTPQYFRTRMEIKMVTP